MESLIKRDLINLNRLFAFVSFLVTFIPRFSDFNVEHIYFYPAMSIACFCVLVFVDYTRSWKAFGDYTRKGYIIFGIVLMVSFLICLIFALPGGVTNNGHGWNTDAFWIGYFIIQCSWFVMGAIYLVLGITKTIDENKK